MVSVEYFTVFVLVMSLCQKSQGACRCLHSQECYPSYTQCVSGCEYGFAGSKCQYANLLAYSSCRKKKTFAADGDYHTCKLTGYLTCESIDPSATPNTIRITHPNSALKNKYFVSDDGGWSYANLTREVTSRTTEYSFRGVFRKKTFSLNLEQATVCEIEVFQACTGSGQCSSECNCFNASDCLSGRPSCPSGCAPGYSNVDHGCQESEVATIPDTKKQSTPTKGSVLTEMSTNPTERPPVVQVCRHDQCHGHGTCKNVNQEPRCNCYDGYTGSRCETERPPVAQVCLHDQCHGHGTCENVNQEPRCNCDDGYTGSRCETATPETETVGGCSLNCGSHGACERVDNRETCVCDDGYKGRDCKTRTPESETVGGCLLNCGSHGVCALVDKIETCDCADGYKGRYCNTNCQSGYYGEDCKTRCSEGCQPRYWCNHVDGSCICRNGWTGNKCLSKCEAGSYGKDCGKKCGQGCQGGTCNHDDGKCSCKTGWRTEKCSKICQIGSYGARCGKQCSGGCNQRNCSHVDGSCECKDGWRGRTCSEECPGGTYGHNCSSSCSLGCYYSTGLCDHVNGECKRGYYGRRCKDGWTHLNSRLQRCDKICQIGSYGARCGKQCSGGCNQRNCSHVDGSCECKDGWRGRTCSAECPGGTYGHNCSSSCSLGCYSTRPCDHVNGECKRGYYGRRCKDGWTHLNSRLQRCDKKECSVGCDGECDPTNGRCDNCEAGWTHIDTSLPKCDSKCTSGHFGQDCRKTCSEGCKSRKQCNHIDGSCTCKEGWKGTKCLSTCPNTTYGAGCRLPCGEGCRGGTCHHANGTCNCKAGWQGDRCDTRCSNKTYGDGCRKPCGEGCQYTCDHVNGSCSCKDGWIGHRCSLQCNAGLYGPYCSKTCNEGCVPEHCDYVDGNCDQCKDGWTGSNCEYKCRRWKYGPGCTETCGRNCISCHHVSGNCGSNCRLGWYGENCTGTCRPGFYGNGCKSECNKGCKPDKCNTKNGKCGSDCREGWTGEDCIDECVPGTYGENCVFNCSEGCISQTCDRVSGRCEDCLVGWQHQDLNTSRCDKKCDNGTYGEGCRKDCSVYCMNQSCHHVKGVCEYGCLDGRSGIYCEVSLKDGPDTGTMYLVAICIVLILLLVILLLLYLFREPLKKRLTSKREAADGERFPMEGNQRPSGRQDIDEEGPGVVMNGSDNIYANYSIIASSTCVPITGLKEYVEKKKSKKAVLSDEYAKLPQGLTAAHDIALTERNSPKNRFRGIYPYNHSLVAIKTSKGKPGYINANYIDGLTRGKQYIATQGPLPHTVEDFWEMIWQHNVPVIAMLANVMEDGKRRCEAYWPNEPDITTLTWGSITVSVSDECTLADSTIRTLKLQKGREIRTVKHVHYRVWPDKGVPSDTMSLVALRHKVRSFCDFNDGPMVVHCSAGVGRTGTLIALDYLMEQADTHNRVDIYGCVWTLRGFRVKMVQTEIQYVFLHDCLLDALWYTPYPMPASLYANEFKQRESGNKQSPNLDVEFKKLEESPVSDHPCKAAVNESNRQKNRTHHILPGDLHRPFLMSQVAGHTDYINAVIVPSYEKQNGYIMTQSPLKSTVVDFWRLIQDQNIRGVVLLDNYTENDNDCGVFWAKEGQSSKFGPFTVDRGKVEEHTGFIMENYSYESENGNGDVVVFRCSFWPQKDSLPESTSRFLGFFDFVRQWKSGTAPLVVVCRDGCTRSGLFCVLAYALERLQMENEVAIYHAVRRMRHVRRQVIPTREQFDFCHDAVKTYIESFKAYSNLG